MRRIPVIWFVEHVAREMDVACAVKCLAKHKCGLDIEIRHIYLHANESLDNLAPLVVVHPFFYYAQGALATEDYVEAWPEAIHFNLAWEELYYNVYLKVKAPADEFTRKRVVHHAWGDFFKRYLMDNGVPEDHILVNGQPAYQLYLPPYSRYYRDRSYLASHYGLDNSRRWVFFPENYRWAFHDDAKLQRVSGEGAGANMEDLRTMRDFCSRSLVEVLRWCRQLANHREVEVVFRPRPVTMEQEMRDFYRRNIGQLPENLHILKGETAREWIMASDVVTSSYSTTLIEASIAGKPVFMSEPVPIPEILYCGWYDYVDRLRDVKAFEEACLTQSNGNTRLAQWARGTMLSRGDPIAGLVDIVHSMVQSQRQTGADKRWVLGRSLRRKLFRMTHERRNYFNPRTHENDVFTQEDIDRGVTAWRGTLVSGPC